MRMGILDRLRDRLECRRIGPLLQPFLDGELDDDQRRRVARHLEACRRCGLEAATYTALIDRLGDATSTTDQRDAVARLEAFVDDLTDAPDDGAGPTGG